MEDYLSWRIQFITFLVTQQLSGFFDGTIETPLTYILDVHCIQYPNPTYSVWLRLDPLIRSWLFATISHELFTDVHNVIHSKQIWDGVSQRFSTASVARAMDLRQTLTNHIF